MIIRTTIIIGFAILLAACLSDESNNSSRFSLYVTDAPMDGAAQVVVQFSGVEVHRAKGTETINFQTPKQIDLAYFSRGAAAYLVEYVELPAGDYEWVRLKVDAVAGVDDSYIVFGDGDTRTKYELAIPTDALDALKVVSPFTLTAGDAANFTIDFDLRRSIHLTADGYVLRPVLRMVENTQSGSIYGSVNSGFLTDMSCTTGAAVYVYSGESVTPTDISANSGGPFASTSVALYWYIVGFLPTGVYTVALTCDGDLDQPDAVDSLTFLAQSNVTVPGGRVAIPYDFIPE